VRCVTQKHVTGLTVYRVAVYRSKYCNLFSTPSHSSASARASFWVVMFGHISASSAFSSR